MENPAVIGDLIGCISDQDLTNLYWIRAKCYHQQGTLDLAIENYTEVLKVVALREEPRAQILLQRGRAKRRNEQNNLAIKDLDEALACSIKDQNLKAQLLYYKGLVLGESEESLAQANAILTEALGYQLNGYMKASILCARGTARNQLNYLKGAIKDATDALACDFTDDALKIDILSLRASAQWKKHEKLDDSIEDYSQALGLIQDPLKKARLFLARGTVFNAMGNKEKARQDWEAAKRCCPESEGGLLKEIQDRLSGASSPSTPTTNRLSLSLSRLGSPFASNH